MLRQLIFGLTIAVLWPPSPGLRADEWTDLSMSGEAQADWRFVGGDWNENDDGHIQPPGELVDENLAIFTRQAYGDFEAEFEFRWDSIWTTAGLVFRAQDASIPQQLRYQLIRVTPNNVEPNRVFDVAKADIKHRPTNKCRLSLRESSVTSFFRSAKDDNKKPRDAKAERDDQSPPSKILLLIGGPFDHHPVGSHEYMAGLRIISKCLEDVEGLNIRITNSEDAWSEGPDMIDSADGVLLFREQGARWLKQDPERLAAFERLAKRGGGCAALHFGTGTVDAENIEPFVSIFGACHGGPDRKDNVFETTLTIADPQHPVCRGISPFAVRDEFYYQLKRVKPPAMITPLLQATLEGNAETIAWAWDRADGGRSFGFTGLHFHENWKLTEYRRLVAQGILWSLKLPIPEDGVKVDIPDDVLQLFLMPQALEVPITSLIFEPPPAM